MASAEIYNKALDLLSRREHSRKELYLKLTKRFESKEDINFNLDRLEEKNLLSDSRFAEEYVQARRKKGFGPIKISAELEKRGVNDSLISNEINKFDDWEDLAELSVTELMEIESSISESDGAKLIMKAREPWFEETA